MRPALVIAACVAMGAGAESAAQAGGPANRATQEEPVEKTALIVDERPRAVRIAAMEAWLANLVGRFLVDGEQTTAGGKTAFKASASCQHFGDGPGVRCVIRRSPTLRDPQLSQFKVEGVREELTLPLLYFGLDPEHLEIQAITIDHEQPAAQSGSLEGNAIRFSGNWNSCIRNWAQCWMLSEIAAEPEGAILMKIVVDAWAQGSKGPPFGLTRAGHTVELEMRLSREPVGKSAAGRELHQE